MSIFTKLNRRVAEIIKDINLSLVPNLNLGRFIISNIINAMLIMDKLISLMNLGVSTTSRIVNISSFK
ncbi:hypothetical protein [Wukongibacter baidiensis]